MKKKDTALDADRNDGQCPSVLRDNREKVMSPKTWYKYYLFLCSSQMKSPPSNLNYISRLSSRPSLNVTTALLLLKTVMWSTSPTKSSGENSVNFLRQRVKKPAVFLLPQKMGTSTEYPLLPQKTPLGRGQAFFKSRFIRDTIPVECAFFEGTENPLGEGTNRLRWGQTTELGTSIVPLVFCLC